MSVCEVEVCPTCGRKTSAFDRKFRRCLDGCGHMLEQAEACFENGHADGSSDVGHAKGCDGSCGIPKEGKRAKKVRRRTFRIKACGECLGCKNGGVCTWPKGTFGEKACGECLGCKNGGVCTWPKGTFGEKGEAIKPGGRAGSGGSPPGGV